MSLQPLPPGLFSGLALPKAPGIRYRSRDTGAIYEGTMQADGFWVKKLAYGDHISGPPLGFEFRWGHEADALDVVDFKPEAMVSFPYCGDPGDEDSGGQRPAPGPRATLVKAKELALAHVDEPGASSYRRHYWDGYADGLALAIATLDRQP